MAACIRGHEKECGLATTLGVGGMAGAPARYYSSIGGGADVCCGGGRLVDELLLIDFNSLFFREYSP